jgi:hypothetical protein
MSSNLSEVFPHFNENNGNVLLPRIIHVPEVPGEVQDTDHGPFIMCDKLTCANGKKIMELVKDPESGYQRHPQFGEFILVPNQISNVISSNENQYYRKIEGTYWVSTEVHYDKHLNLEEYIEKYCEFKQFEGSQGETLLIPVYKS